MSSEFVDFQQDISGIAAQFNIPAGAESNIYQREKVSAPNKVPITYDSSPVDIRSNGDEPLIGFELPGHQNIPSDGKMQTVILFEKSIPVDYEYHAAPKIEPAVFLLAKIGDFGQYNLLNGHANIFLQETFIGRTNVNPKITADTLLLSLGRDEQVTIDRIQPKDFTERRKIFGSKIRETCQYEISIKNNKSKPVTVDLIDQFPISKQKDIVVELGDHSGAKVSPEFGKLEWNVEIPAGQTKKIRFSYSVEYPKDKGVRYFKG